jgi:hypothetical protein
VAQPLTGAERGDEQRRLPQVASIAEVARGRHRSPAGTSGLVVAVPRPKVGKRRFETGVAGGARQRPSNMGDRLVSNTRARY